MIERYSRKEMVKIWSQQEKFNIWFQIEAHACDAQAELGIIPKESAKVIWKKGKFDINKIDEIEKTTKHDVIAFLTNLAEYIGDDARFVHQGMTSSDILDTTLSIQLQRASDILLNDLETLMKTLKRRSIEHKNTISIGRSHGIHAEPVTFGLKLAGYYAEFRRNKKRLIQAREEISTCAISGAVGTFANINPNVEKYVAKKLNLKVEPISTQVIPRDRHAFYFSVLAIIAGSIERVATEIRHLQRTEVYELQEFFSKNQKGSSAMPHKKNPILSENLTGLSRMVRSAVIPALENIALWHERDISHSSVERNIGPDANITLDFALVRLTNIMNNIVVYPKKMLKNLNITKGLIFSQELMLELTKSGLSREQSYRIVQNHAKKCFTENLNLIDVISSDKFIMSKIKSKKLKSIFNYSKHFKNVNFIFRRVFK